MKKTVCMIFFLALLLTHLSACDASFSVQGLDNYSENHSSYGTTGFLLNGEKLWEKYNYIDGDYFYFHETEEFLPKPIRETCLIYIIFDEGVYEEAKEFVLLNIEKPKQDIWYNGYCFCEEAPGYATQDHINFKRVTFNDDKRTILFIGFWLDPTDEDQQILNSYRGGNIQPFLEEYFPMYDFSK